MFSELGSALALFKTVICIVTDLPVTETKAVAKRIASAHLHGQVREYVDRSSILR